MPMNRNKNSETGLSALVRSPLEVALEIVALGGILCTVLALLQSWGNLPESIPIHFGITGQPDHWGSKSILWLLPTMGTCLYLVLTLSPLLPQLLDSPFPIPEDRGEGLLGLVRELFGWMKVQIIWLFFLINWQMIQVGLGQASAIATISIFTGVIFLGGTIAFYFQQAERNDY
jgi:hypothetical protein